MALDILIENSTLIDGTGATPRHADVGIENGRIAVRNGALTGVRPSEVLRRTY